MREAGLIRAEQEKQLADYIAAQVSNQVVGGFARVQSRFMRWLVKALSRRG